MKLAITCKNLFLSLIVVCLVIFQIWDTIRKWSELLCNPSEPNMANAYSFTEPIDRHQISSDNNKKRVADEKKRVDDYQNNMDENENNVDDDKCGR